MTDNYSTRIIPISKVDPQEWNMFLLNSSESTYFCTTDHWENFEEVYFLQIRNSMAELLAGIPFRADSPIPLIGGYFKICRLDSSVIVNQSLLQNEISSLKKVAFLSLISYLKRIHVVFIYMSPMTRSHDAVLLKELGFGNDKCATLKIDLSIDVDEIYKSFSKGSKSSTKVAIKKGVQVKIFEGELALPYLSDFFELQKRLFEYKRDSYSKVYFKTESFLKSIFSSTVTKSHLAIAYYNDKPAAIAILLSFNGLIYYYLGASDYHLIKESKASNLLQLEIIKYAKEKGYLYYDFGGIPFNTDPAIETYGVYLFKKSFGGQRLEYDNGNYVLKKFRYRIIWYLQRKQHHPVVSFAYNLLKRNSKS